MTRAPASSSADRRGAVGGGAVVAGTVDGTTVGAVFAALDAGSPLVIVVAADVVSEPEHAASETSTTTIARQRTARDGTRGPPFAMAGPVIIEPRSSSSAQLPVVGPGNNRQPQ